MQKKFSTLSPITLQDDKIPEIYKTIFREALEDKDVWNVGVTGSNGSGKSSLIKSVEKTCEKKFMYISLADFKSFDSEKQENENNISNIEKKIINQLIHQVDETESNLIGYKQSIKNRKKNLEMKNIFSEMFIELIAFLFVFKLQLTYLKPGTDFFSWFIYYILILYPILFIFFIIYDISKVSKNINKNPKLLLDKVSYANLELTLNNDEKKESYFDRYLIDILCLFDQSNFEVVIFEDLDRFENYNIFVRLREINYLINKANNDKKTIKFFYVINDNDFIPEEKTKFFELIIPVLPITTSNNSYDRLIELFSNEVDTTFRLMLERISRYIVDFRLLKNITNEYKIYYQILIVDNKLKLQPTQLYSIIVYKNLYTNDYQQLLRREGNMFFLLNGAKNVLKGSRKKPIHTLLKENITHNSVVEEYKKHINYEGRDRDLIFELLLYGYIDEHFEDYTTYFCGADITVEDKNFIVRVQSERESKYNKTKAEISESLNYEIKDIERVFKELTIYNFKSSYILNYKIAERVIEDDDEVILKIFLDTLCQTKVYHHKNYPINNIYNKLGKKYQPRYLLFLLKYSDEKQVSEIFRDVMLIMNLVSSIPRIFKILDKKHSGGFNNNYSLKKIFNLIESIFAACDLETILNVNKITNNGIVVILNKYEGYFILNWKTENNKKFVSFLKRVNYIFEENYQNDIEEKNKFLYLYAAAYNKGISKEELELKFKFGENQIDG